MIGDTLYDTPDWMNEVRRLLIALRERAGYTALDQLLVPDMYWTSVWKLETGQRSQLLFNQVYVLCRYYDCNPRLLLGASDGVLDSAWPLVKTSKRSKARSEIPEFAEWDVAIRKRLRAFRRRADRGTRATAKGASVGRRWLIHVEAGAQESLDLIRVHRVLRYLGRSMSELFDYTALGEAGEAATTRIPGGIG